MFQYTIPPTNEPIKQTDFQPATHYPPPLNEYWPVYSEPPKHKISTSIWDDENTICYQVDVRGISVARRQDNDMINGTKLLNVTGMSRGKRDGILKNERGRVVVKVGAMHLKGVWITFARAKALAIQYSILDFLYPLFLEDPSSYFYQLDYFLSSTHTNTIYSQDLSISDNEHSDLPALHPHLMSEESLFSCFQEEEYYPIMNPLASAPSVPSMLPIQYPDTMNYYS